MSGKRLDFPEKAVCGIDFSGKVQLFPEEIKAVEMKWLNAAMMVGEKGMSDDNED